MKLHPVISLAALLAALPLHAQDAAPASIAAQEIKSPVQKELAALIGRVRDGLQAGKTTEAEFGDEIKAFDALLASHAGDKGNDVAMIAFMKAMLCSPEGTNTKTASGFASLMRCTYGENSGLRSGTRTESTTCPPPASNAFLNASSESMPGA